MGWGTKSNRERGRWHSWKIRTLFRGDAISFVFTFFSARVRLPLNIGNDSQSLFRNLQEKELGAIYLFIAMVLLRQAHLSLFLSSFFNMNSQ